MLVGPRIAPSPVFGNSYIGHRVGARAAPRRGSQRASCRRMWAHVGGFPVCDPHLRARMYSVDTDLLPTSAHMPTPSVRRIGLGPIFRDDWSDASLMPLKPRFPRLPRATSAARIRRCIAPRPRLISASCGRDLVQNSSVEKRNAGTRGGSAMHRAVHDFECT